MSESFVSGVDFVTMPSSDLEASKQFYGETLGLPMSATYQRDGTPAFGHEFETGNLTLSLFNAKAAGIEMKPNGGPVALHVDDVEVRKSELESKGVKFAGDTMDSGVCHMAIFQDPDGNSLMLHNRYAPKD